MEKIVISILFICMMSVSVDTQPCSFFHTPVSVIGSTTTNTLGQHRSITISAATITQSFLTAMQQDYGWKLSTTQQSPAPN